MAKQLNFKFKDKEYCLEFTRATIMEMESKGFVANDIGDKPMSTLPKLFAGAFKAHHPREKAEVIEEIYANMPDKKSLISCLGEMYSEPINALLDEPEKDSKNVINWTPSFKAAAAE